MDGITCVIIIVLSNCISISLLLCFSKIKHMENAIKSLEKDVSDLKESGSPNKNGNS